MNTHVQQRCLRVTTCLISGLVFMLNVHSVAALPSPTRATERDPVIRTVMAQSTIQGNKTAPGTTYTVGTGDYGETIVAINGEGTTVTLPDIQQEVASVAPNVKVLSLEDATNKVWLAHANLLIGRGVTLKLTTETVRWLKLRSQDGAIAATRATGEGSYDYKSFVWLRAQNGTILIDGVKVTSWDSAKNEYDTNVANGRSYLLAKGDARMNIANGELSYLGSADGESYGVSWRDTNSDQQPDVLRTRVTGEVTNSTLSYNYYGIYTFQASNMVFRGNRFHHNLSYGFDPHDFTNHVLVENNESFENGNHGFIISRGCNNFVFRGNTSYNNRYRIGEDERRAHGFMIDPGSPSSQYLQVPSFDNLYENNQAYGNDGYGMRVLGSNTNTIQNNVFRNNLQGVTIEQGSTGNTLTHNMISDNGLYGVFLFGGADSNAIEGNTITRSGSHGIYIKTGKNTVANNSILDNGTTGATPVGAGIATLRESTAAAALADFTLPNHRTSIATSAPELLGTTAQASDIAGNTMVGNMVSGNVEAGIELKNAVGTSVKGNTVSDNRDHGIYLTAGTRNTNVFQNVVSSNGGQGIRANGPDTTANTWSENQVFNNRDGGIVVTSAANSNIVVPRIARIGNLVIGNATPGAVIELFSDNGNQGQFFETRITASSDGSFRAERTWQGANITATATDSVGNSSAFAVNDDSQLTVVYIPLVQQ